MLPISVCIIARDEERYIGNCLAKLKPYGFEIIVVDTGSKDRTRSIALEYTDKVYCFNWIDDFSAARNFCISKAENEYILVLDCDEYLEKLNVKELEQILADHSSGSFLGTVECRSLQQFQGRESMSLDQITRFFSRRFFTYSGSIHEQIVPINPELSFSYVEIPVILFHAGYETPEILAGKARRNSRLLEKELQRHPDDPYLYYQLGKSYAALQEDERSYEYFGKGLEFDLNPELEYVQSMVEAYGYCMLRLGKFEEAILLESVYETFKKRADFVFLMGLVYMNNALFEKAVLTFLEAASISDFVVQGVNGYMAYYNAGVIRECMGLKKEAAALYERCGEYEPAKERLECLQSQTMT